MLIFVYFTHFAEVWAFFIFLDNRSVFRDAARIEAILAPLVRGAWLQPQPSLNLVQPHLFQAAIHYHLVHQVPRFYIVQFVEIVLALNTLAIEELFDSIDVGLEGLSELVPVDCVADQVYEHRLDRASALH